MKIKKFAKVSGWILAIIFVLVCVAQIGMYLVDTEFVDDLSEPRIRKLYNASAKLNTSEIAIESIDFIPLYNQRAYRNVKYGDDEGVDTNGCGLVSVWMIATYLNDEVYDINELAEKFGEYATDNGSLWKLFIESAPELGLEIIPSDCPNGEWYDWRAIKVALENGKPVICLQRNSIFTDGGHFIVLTGLTEDGKVLVNDPNGRNWWKSEELREGFENGFTEEQIRDGAVAYWMYEAKM